MRVSVWCVFHSSTCHLSRPTESSQNDGGNEDTRTAESSQNDGGNEDTRTAESSQNDGGNEDTRTAESSQNDGGNEDTRTAESSQNDGGNEDILSQKVYGKLAYVLYCMILYVYCSIMHACSVSIDGLVLLISISSYTSQ